MKPSTSVTPRSLYGYGRNAEDVADFFMIESGKEAEPDNLRFECVVNSQFLECLIQRNQFDCRQAALDFDFISLLAAQSVPALDALFAACLIDQNPPHRLCGGCKEVTTPI